MTANLLHDLDIFILFILILIHIGTVYSNKYIQIQLYVAWNDTIYIHSDITNNAIYMAQTS
jgi:hypothetical protein